MRYEIDFDHLPGLSGSLPQKKFAFLSETPNNYIKLDEFFTEEHARQLNFEISQIHPLSFVEYKNPQFEFNKYTCNKVETFNTKLSHTLMFLNSPEVIAKIEAMTGFKNLISDWSYWGAGVHETRRGGYLAVHKDFNILPSTYDGLERHRRVLNLIVYLSDWKDHFGGKLEFWSNGAKEPYVEIEPEFNRAVLFDTRCCYHGHPHPYAGDSRKSIAVYYYVHEDLMPSQWSSTDYKKLPWMEDSIEYKQARADRKDPWLRYGKK